ncbi:MerR family transcriptional regulator [Fuscibacter oryzae]|uniref:MerR family transcriptional regulator n=1 Tax=Fuscibacter oryzae TaxID=2803939 RepID=A0A8J7MQC9_9RHOB|nr:MerR family transcriptional regulator [Fuscibacter oryzae]MBL4927637.1 MerR family transcriptional regulator [Fuscibacter oryzae]
MDKSPEAFRTISEVADLLETPAHVLRFWESRFPQIRPVKRAGGRRYYRPADVALLSGIKRLLHEEGMTIRGVQKMLREQGVRHVAEIGGDAHAVEEDAEAALEAALTANFPKETAPAPADEPETAQIVALETALKKDPVRPRKPEQPNLFRGLFDDLAPPAAAPEEPLFEQVTEALAVVSAEPPVAEQVPEAPMMIDADDDDLQDRIVALTRMATESEVHDSKPESPAKYFPAPVPVLAADASLAARISAAPRALLAAHRETLRALRDRLIVLEDRMIGPRY